MAKDTILFDINETVLDLSTLKPRFSDVFGDEGALSLWFARLLHASTVCATTSVKTDFATLAQVMLDNVATQYDVALSEAQKQHLMAGFAELAPHPDIKPALASLREAGFKTVAFSNSSSQLIAKQIKNAGLSDYFDEVISVELTGSFKPDPFVYQYAAKRLNTPLEQMRLVATHDWDTHGSLTVGMKAAYIARNGIPYNLLVYRVPDIIGHSMDEIAQKIIEKN